MKRIEDHIAQRLSPERLSHVLSVAEEADRMSRIFGLDRAEAELMRRAALLHDVTKEMPLDQQIEYLAQNGVSPSEDDLLAGETLHALSGALKAKEEFSLPDAFCDAIRRHSTGARAMTLYDKILFAADYIEKTRPYSDCREQREFFWENISKCTAFDECVEILDRVVYNIANLTVIYLIKRDLFVHPNTLWMRNALSFKVKGIKK